MTISRIELLKDLRYLDHYRHEFLVFSLRVQGKGDRYLYMEREDSDASTLFFPLLRRLASMRPFSYLLAPTCRRIFAPFRPLLDIWPFNELELDRFTLEELPAGDLLSFFTPGEPADKSRREHVQSVFDVHLELSKNPFTLRRLIQLMRDLQEGHPKYRLLGANCWSWSRAMLLSIALEECGIREIHYKGRTVTSGELKAYLTTMYGAWGGLLLRFIDKPDLDSTDYLAIRILFLTYSVASWIFKLKQMMFGPISWAIRLRSFSIFSDRTCSEDGKDYTYIPVGPDLVDLVPGIPNPSVMSMLETAHCSPGHYLYLATAPISTRRIRIKSLYIFLAGYMVDNHDPTAVEEIRELSWFKCSILRRTESGYEIGPCEYIDLKLCFRESKADKRQWYSAMHVMDPSHPITNSLRTGDIMALWAKGYPGREHRANIAMIKVTKRPDSVQDFLLDSIVAAFACSALARLILFATFDPQGNRLLQMWRVIHHNLALILCMFACIPWWLNRWGENWVWSKFAEVAQHMIRIGSPIILPKGSKSSMDLQFSHFLQSALSRSAELHRLELCRHERDEGQFLVLYFSNDGIDYCIHVPETSRRQQFFAIVSDISPFTSASAKVYASGSLEGTALEAHQVTLAIHFRKGTNKQGKTALQVISEDLVWMERHCLRYYFFNCVCWTWMWSLAHMVIHHAEEDRVHSHVTLGDGEEMVHDGILRERYEQWRHAEMRRYDEPSEHLIVLIPSRYPLTVYCNRNRLRHLSSNRLHPSSNPFWTLFRMDNGMSYCSSLYKRISRNCF